MTPALLSLLRDLRAAGLELEPRGHQDIHVQPRTALTPERRQLILMHKAELLATLDLEARIRAMAARWQYSPDDLAEAFTAASTDPAGWLVAVDQDEKFHRNACRAGMAYPC